MQDEPNRTSGKRDVVGDPEPSTAASIRQAFLAHMDEQQRQWRVAAETPGTRRPAGGKPLADRKSDTGLVEEVRGQQHTGNHDKPAGEAHGSDARGGTRAGAENVEPKKR